MICTCIGNSFYINLFIEYFTYLITQIESKNILFNDIIELINTKLDYSINFTNLPKDAIKIDKSKFYFFYGL